jgi:hypothetical protein
MSTYSTDLLPWASRGVLPPSDYKFSKDGPVVAEYNNALMFNLIKDVRYLIDAHNNRLGSVRSDDTPSNPRPGDFWYESDFGRLHFYNAKQNRYDQLALDNDLAEHIFDDNPHGLTPSLIGALEDTPGSVGYDNLNAGAISTLDSRYVTLSQASTIEANLDLGENWTFTLKDGSQITLESNSQPLSEYHRLARNGSTLEIETAPSASGQSVEFNNWLRVDMSNTEAVVLPSPDSPPASVEGSVYYDATAEEVRFQGPSSTLYQLDMTPIPESPYTPVQIRADVTVELNSSFSSITGDLENSIVEAVVKYIGGTYEGFDYPGVPRGGVVEWALVEMAARSAIPYYLQINNNRFPVKIDQLTIGKNTVGASMDVQNIDLLPSEIPDTEPSLVDVDFNFV